MSAGLKTPPTRFCAWMQAEVLSLFRSFPRLKVDGPFPFFGVIPAAALRLREILVAARVLRWIPSGREASFHGDYELL